MEDSAQKLRSFLETCTPNEIGILKSWFSELIKSETKNRSPRGALDKALEKACRALAEKGEPITLSTACMEVFLSGHVFSTGNMEANKAYVGVRLGKISKRPNGWLAVDTPKKGMKPAIYKLRNESHRA